MKIGFKNIREFGDKFYIPIYSGDIIPSSLLSNKLNTSLILLYIKF